jgi:RNA polymerase subunit RPABC4/transcription elongation factor Spt4
MPVNQPRCPRCGSFGRGNVHFCVVCGSRYNEPISGDALALAARRQQWSQHRIGCHRCAAPVRAGARFCPACGVRTHAESGHDPAIAG